MPNEATQTRTDTPAEVTGNRAARRAPVYLTRYDADDEAMQRQAEQFYLQKQIQAQTPMVIVLEDGSQVEGVIEWYDRNCLKVRGRERTLVYKSAIKYMYKHGENAR
ncbi:MAG: RNA chaperone Hfq [Terracidiphilus sp.]|nr:RNA chaperone Hfq [Terracidiphilus sp.]